MKLQVRILGGATVSNMAAKNPGRKGKPPSSKPPGVTKPTGKLHISITLQLSMYIDHVGAESTI